MPPSRLIAACTEVSGRLAALPATTVQGEIAALSGLAVELRGLAPLLAVGDRMALHGREGSIAAEIVGFRDGLAQALAFGPLDGLGPGRPAEAALPPRPASLAVSDQWLGRVVDPLGRPLDGRGALPPGPAPRPVRAAPPPATGRSRLGPRFGFGVRALDLFVPSREGQRLGLFAGAGVGKSTLLAMLAGHADCDVAVLALVGERGREVREFIEDTLGEAGLAHAVVVVATSDAPPLLRREAAYAAMTIAEHFRDQGRRVLLLLDSLTRTCLALREIALAAGEAPGARGYPPSVFAELPRLLERAGPGAVATGGQITGLFTVLVEGDDMNDPVADAVRSILDGHVVLDRRIAERGRYPAIDVLRSLSRTATTCTDAAEQALAAHARAALALQAELADLVRLGAYRPGADPAADEALALAPRIEALLRQAHDAPCPLPDALAGLRAALDGGPS
ncbi:MAG TPA: FliI/YscN family ATPase [Acetobacteraceae bacterium]|nr:FliI/YscN family ATPase [Acetobacteraceae bacterium]